MLSNIQSGTVKAKLMSVILVDSVRESGAWICGKVPGFRMLQRTGRVYTKLVSDVKTDALMPGIKEKICPDSIVYTDTFASYDVLNVSNFKLLHQCHRIQFVDKNCRQNHISGIENV